MPQPKRSRRVLAPLGVASIAVLFVLVVGPAIATAQGDGEAQCMKREAPLLQEPPPIKRPPPPLKALVFNGDVTIDGNAPSSQGYTITAKIGRYWESTAVPVGVGSGCGNMRYAYLFVAPPEELDLFGREITFWLNGQVQSHDVDQRYAAPITGEALATPGTYPNWIFPILRHVDLEFPALPGDYQPDASLPPTGGTSPSKPMLAVFLILGLLAMLSGSVAARRW